MIYQEMKQCEDYALLNMLTFEAAIRHPKVKELLAIMDSASAEEQLDALMNDDDKYKKTREILKEKYLLDYDKYREYKIQKEPYLKDYNHLLHIHKKLKDDINIGINRTKSLKVVASAMLDLIQKYKKSNSYNLHLHKKESKYIHYANLPFYRPLMTSREEESVIRIEIPLLHVHKNDFSSYFEELQKNINKTLDEIDAYHKLSQSFYSLIEKGKNKSETLAKMFFTWDYVEYFESCHLYTPDYKHANLYADITEIVGGEINEKTARSTAQNYFTPMKKLIMGAEYLNFYKFSLT